MKKKITRILLIPVKVLIQERLYNERFYNERLHNESG